MKTPYSIVGVVALGCALLVGLQLAGLGAPAAVAKFVASSAFVALAVRQGALASWYGRLVLAGLGLSWCGDLFLVGGSPTFFLAGLTAFLLAHVAYSAAFLRHGVGRVAIALSTVPVALIAMLVWNWLEPQTPAELALPVRTYVAVISLMVIFAYGTRGAGGSWLVPAGATLFFLSDLSVAALRLAGTDYPTYALGLPAYYAAQVCLALSVSQSRSH
jgi:uncharacterized membrane protein YhhN